MLCFYKNRGVVQLQPLYFYVSLILFIIILGTIVLIHELGHFLFAKLFGVYVYEYSIGMGKKLWSKKPKNSET